MQCNAMQYITIYLNSHVLQTRNSSVTPLGENMKMKNECKQMRDEDDVGISVKSLIKMENYETMKHM